MESRNLSTSQAGELYTTIRPTYHYLFRVLERMKERGFPPDDSLFILVFDCHEHLKELCSDLHRRSMVGGWMLNVVKPPEELP